MEKGLYLPEGTRLVTEKNQRIISDPAELEKCVETGEILEARAVLCDASRNLIVDLNGISGIIPRSETAAGIESGVTREIAVIARVGKPVCFNVVSVKRENDRPVVTLSRRRAQEAAAAYILDNARRGDVLNARVTHLEPFGAFVDIGCGFNSLIGIENISVSRISHPADRFYPGMDIFAAVSSIDMTFRRVSLSHRELLGTWEENAALFSSGETVTGIVRGTEEYGSFVELTPNLSGLAERREGLRRGDGVSVFIKSILPERMKIKLLVIDRLSLPPHSRLRYFISEGHIDRWIYSPASCKKKLIETDFRQKQKNRLSGFFAEKGGRIL